MVPARYGGKLDGLVFVLVASQVFMALSFVRLLGNTASAAFGTGIIEVVLKQPIWGTRLGAELVRFVVTLVVLHALLAVCAWTLALVSRVAWPAGGESQRSLAIVWFLCLVVWLMAANATWFPQSSLGEPYSRIVRAGVGGASVFAALTTVLASGVLVVFVAAGIRKRALVRSSKLWVTGLACLSVGVALPVINASGHAGGGIRDDRPHVVLIGVDSLRKDFVQNDALGLTPEIDAFLSGATQFSNAYTPLARTFPAWVSVLSGRHPHTTGAFVNLLPRELIDEGEAMPKVLAADGYRTVYAIDEVRFSNLDESYGFDEMLAPPMGAADFMLGFFADTPLANVLVNTRVGKWLFPYAYANRAAATTYDPDTFIDRIGGAVSFDEPTLLAVHFTLVHWPYTWAAAPIADSRELSRLSLTERAHRNYTMAVRRVDEQFGDLMDLLRAKGALDNAIVIVLSDHGESLGEPSLVAAHDPIIDRLLDDAPEVYGHGTDVFSPDQYHVVLGVRAFGNDVFRHVAGRTLDMPVSLEDIAPTVLDLLDLGRNQIFDGRSLAPHLRSGTTAQESERIRFLETEFNPIDISPEVIVTASAISSVSDKYEIDPDTDRVRVRRGFIREMLDTRQYAAESVGRILASIPAADPHRQHLLYFDPAIGRPRLLDAAPTTADGQAAVELWRALERRFPAVRERSIVRFGQ